jgi:hypothetical protein
MADFRDFKLNNLSDIASEKLSSSDGASTNGGLTATETGEADPSDEYKKMRDKIIADEEKAVRKARTLVVVALCTCIIAVSSAIYVFASNGDKFSFELEVSDRDSLAPYSPVIHCNIILSFTVTSSSLSSTKAMQKTLLIWCSGKFSTTLLWYSSSVLP